MSTTETTHQLTADEIKAMRKARGAAFHYQDGRAFVALTTEYDPGDGFGKRELRREVDAEFKATIYEKDMTTNRTTPTKCFWSLVSARFSPEWQTALTCMKAGDELILHWTGGNSSERHRSDGYTIDEFRVELRRYNKERTKLVSHLVFLLGVQAIPPGRFRDITF